MDHRIIVYDILWLLRADTSWSDLPERYGSWSTVASRFYYWQKAGIWQRLFEAVQQQAEAQGKINWDVHDRDGAIVRAHQHARAGRRAATEALCCSQGGFNIAHLQATDNKHLMTFVLSPGQRHEAVGFEPLMADGTVKRVGRGRPKHGLARVVGDNAYNSRYIRTDLRRHGIGMTIPHRSTEHRSGPLDRAIYRMREKWSD